ncbi:hypothetical protein ABIE24_000924 [Mycetocola sp. 2940]
MSDFVLAAQTSLIIAASLASILFIGQVIRHSTEPDSPFKRWKTAAVITLTLTGLLLVTTVLLLWT